MKKVVLFFTIPLLLFGFIKLKPDNQQTLASIELQKSQAIGCSPYAGENIEAGADGKFITVLPGWGSYSYAVSTKNDSSQFYFNQGLNMYYSYHWREASSSFKEAARFDSNSVMAYWGEALALGPGYNFSLHYKMRKEIPSIIQVMNQHTGGATDKEKKLVEVMNLRYTTDTADNMRPSLNRAYAQGMHDLVALYPADADIKMLYVDGVMLIHAWDLWNNDGTPKTWTPELVRFCGEVLKESPRHPAALHYYIHLTEASRHPEVAVASADILKDLMPGVAHMVHMSSHEYERNGSYALGVEVNDLADAAQHNYSSLATNLQLSIRLSHLYAVQSYCGLSGAMYTKGLSDAVRCRKSVSPAFDKIYLQYLYMMPDFTRVRMGKWDEILKDETAPDTSWTYAALLYDFARGMAFANTGHPDSARTHLLLLQHKSKNPQLLEADTLTNTALQGAQVAEGILSASIFFTEKKYDSAITHIKQAIHVEDGMFYAEPKDWLIPARQYLGAFYLKSGKPDLAEKVYREDIAWNPGNGWSLLGLCQSLKAQRKTNQIAGYEKQYMQSFSHADHLPPGSVY